MPRNGSGTYTLPAGNPVVSHTPVASVWANTTLTDIATALSQSLSKDGQTAPTANMPMAGFRHTGVGLATALDQYARVSQVQDGSLLRCTAEAMPSQDLYTANLPFGQTAFVDGQLIVCHFTDTNTTTVPTLNVNNSTDWVIVRADGTAIQAGDINPNVPVQLIWLGSAWGLLGVQTGGSSGVASFNSRMGAVVLLSADVVTALGFTPVSTAGGTFTGPIILSGAATTSLQPTTLAQVLALIAAIPSVTGVVSFNTRTGAITLLSADVVAALGFSPVASFNARTGAVTLLSSDVIAALGYVPAAATSPFSYVLATQVLATVAYGNSVTPSKVAFPNEVTDFLSEYNPTLSRFVAGNTGVYQINASVLFDPTSSGSNGKIYIYVNGAALMGPRAFVETAGNNFTNMISEAVALNATDYVEIFFRCDTNGNKLGGAAPYQTSLTVARVS